MEHHRGNNKLNASQSNGGLNKSKRASRPIAYVTNKTQSTLMEKLYSVTAIRLVMDQAQAIFRSIAKPIPKEVPLKTKITYFIGIDMASEQFTATVLSDNGQSRMTRESMSNSMEGFQLFHQWLQSQNIKADNSIICTEATGVYGEALVYYLIAQNFHVAVESPLKVKRAFYPHGHKNDRVDSIQIAEYAYRFFDRLRLWHPVTDTVERLKQSLTAREHLVKQSVAIQNAIKAYQRHVIQDSSVLAIHEKNLAQVKEHISEIDKHISQLIHQDPSLRQLSHWIVSLCGVGSLLAAYLLVITNGFQNITNHKQLAAYIGICPYEFKSGKSIRRQSHCRPFGHAYTKKLLHLASLSIATHNQDFKKYYLRKVQEGKSKMLVLNNIANKILKISFALVREQQPFIKGYKSVNPVLLSA